MQVRPVWGLVIASLVAFVGACADETNETIVLRVANWGGPAVDPSFVRLEHEIRQGFERQHPGVRVQMEHIPGVGQYEPKLLMMFVSGHAPDVIHLDASSAAVFVNHNVLLDLAPRIAGDADFDQGAYFENVFDVARRGNRIYAIPLDFTPMVMVYNKRLFDQAGVRYPRDGWTWQSFLETCKQLTKVHLGARKPVRYGFNFLNWMPGWVPWLWLNGGDVLSPDGRHAVGYFDAPESIEAVQFLVDLIVKHRVAPNLTESAAAGVDLFRAGRAAPVTPYETAICRLVSPHECHLLAGSGDRRSNERNLPVLVPVCGFTVFLAGQILAFCPLLPIVIPIGPFALSLAHLAFPLQPLLTILVPSREFAVWLPVFKSTHS